jgi:hypothetical protein
MLYFGEKAFRAPGSSKIYGVGPQISRNRGCSEAKIRFIFDKMEAPLCFLRQYNADELEPLSRDGLEALLMEIQDEYHLREGEDQLYVDATKPIRALLRKRRRESAGPSPPATQVVEAADAPLGDAPDSAATAKESDGLVVGAPKFGNTKDMAWSRLYTTSTPKSLASASTKSGEWRRPTSSTQCTCKATASTR